MKSGTRPALEMSLPPRPLQEVCRRARTRRRSIPSAYTPSNSAASPFTAPRATNRRTWTYRIRPSVTHRPYEEIPARLIRSGPFLEVPTSPNQLRWDPLPVPEEKTDFVDGIVTLGGNGDPAMQTGRCHPPLRRQRFHAGPFLLHRRWRTADCSAAGRSSLSHGIGNS